MSTIPTLPFNLPENDPGVLTTVVVTRSIVGYKKEESDYLLKFLYDHIALSQDLQARIRWKSGTVVVWDNRIACHSAVFDWEDGQRRHIARLTPQAEQPYETPYEG